MPRAAATVPNIITVETGKLALAGWIAVYATPPGKPIHILDAPTAPEDRGLRIECAANSSLYVRMYLPLASKPGRGEQRSFQGGYFDARAFKSLDGLEWSKEPAHLSRTRVGVKVESAALGPRGLTVPLEKDPALIEAFPEAPAILAPAEAEAADEMTMAEFRHRATTGAAGGQKDRIPGTMLAAMAVLDRLSPAAVKVIRHDHLLVLDAQNDGFAVTIMLPLLRGLALAENVS